jgi:ABC-2 type transport system permease protein
MTAFINHFTFEFRTGIRDKQLLLMNYLLPLGFYLMMGFVMVEINPLFLDTMIPAMVVFAVLSATLLGLPDPLVKAREDGIFRTYKINGVPSISILTIPALTTMLHIVIVSAIISISAPLLFDAPAPTNWPAFALVLLAMAFASSGISLLIGVISSSTRITVLWSQLIYLPSMLLGGLMIPTSLLPDSVAQISAILPSTQAMNAFNGLAIGIDYEPWGAPWGSVAILVIGGLVAYALGVFLFNWDSRNTEQNPVLALIALVPFIAGVFII